ncbi:MAG: UDP-2,3-diacylglucosamine diphosphatase LpxI [Candidatus Omnitrophica bacterium]|nr:UDP-2,3-diacylglucosamine diphosphatase LpxI [Candidatus Omnitrophota bacterium]MDD5430553.1 UDP-2,3-diacylglucosamine diphosphatase LpxI [Candidatus Omnitrophota bacterium]
MVDFSRLAIIAGNRQLPLVLSRRIREQYPTARIIAVCFKGETSSLIKKYVDESYWIDVGQLSKLKNILSSEKINRAFMAGQINPLRIFNQKKWDQELKSLVKETEDFRPHAIFCSIINYLKKQGVTFQELPPVLKNDLAQEGVMNGLSLPACMEKDVEFGLGVICGFVELDIGQTIAVKHLSVVALEALEGTDRAIRRAGRLAGKKCVIFKFSKTRQDLRFDLPVVGLSTLKLLKKIKASGLVLEADKVIILEKEKFLSLSEQWSIPVLGRRAPSR